MAPRFAVTIALCLACACHQTAPEDDTKFLLPGSFSQQTTLADLQALFGSANVQRKSLPDGDEVVLFPNDPERRAYVTFHDAKALTDLARIAVRDPQSRWRGKRGVHVGMSFAELRRLNGKSFYFSGFDDQHRGLAHDQWSPALDDDDGKLGNLDVGEGEHMYFGVELGLRDQGRAAPVEAYPHDGASISSDDPRYPRLGELALVIGFDATTSLDDEWD
jgi:hypothetical protein